MLRKLRSVEYVDTLVLLEQLCVVGRVEYGDTLVLLEQLCVVGLSWG